MILIRSTTVVLLAVLLCVGGVEAARPSHTPPPPPPPPAPLPAADAMPSLITRCDACLLMMSLCSSVDRRRLTVGQGLTTRLLTAGAAPLSELKNNPGLTETLPTELANLLQLELHAPPPLFELSAFTGSPQCEPRLTNGWRLARSSINDVSLNGSTTTAHTPIWVDEGGWESFSGWVDCKNGGDADGDCAM